MTASLLPALLEFGRAARAEGIPVTTRRIEELARALALTGIENRDTVLRTCRALLVTRREHIPLLEALFDRFWRPPGGPPDAPATLPPAPRHRRVQRFTVATYMALRAGADAPEVDVRDRAGTATADEALRRKRFAEMTPEELDAVRRLIRDLRWDAALRVTRRRRADERGPDPDLRRVLARAARTGSVPPRLPRRRRRVKPRPVVLLADVSGSMERYSRLVLQLFHAMAATVPRIEAFAFGTRLTRITPQLRAKDVDRALDEVAREVPDWAGGTRIGASLAAFNREWARRVLRRGAVVVVVSDGCDGEGGEGLAREMRRLSHRAHRVVWLNPYLGHRDYEPRVAGMRAVLPFVDDFLPADDVRSLEAFAELLRGLPPRGGRRAGTRRPRRPRPNALRGPARPG